MTFIIKNAIVAKLFLMIGIKNGVTVHMGGAVIGK